MSKIAVATCIALVTLMSLNALVSGAPSRTKRLLIPTWHLPCGEVLDHDSTSAVNSEAEIMASLESIKLQHQLTLDNYLNRDYDYLYESVRIGVNEHQYIPNWVPGTKDVNMVKSLSQKSTQTIVNHLPKMHMDLQKFAVAFEELVEDEPSSQVQEALRSTQSYLTMMLCEVESNINTLPSITLPSRVPRAIMSDTEREPVDVTRRLVRDWGVVLKYKAYLHAWRHVFEY